MTSKNMEARRVAFEAWVTRGGEVIKNVKREHGFYRLIWVQQSWVAWNAALDSICVELPAPMPSDAPYASYEGGWNDMRAEAQDALTAAGVAYR